VWGERLVILLELIVVMTRQLASRWNAFFFSEEVPYGMALVRMALPLVLLFGGLRRFGFVRELY